MELAPVEFSAELLADLRACDRQRYHRKECMVYKFFYTVMSNCRVSFRSDRWSKV
jgi:hypothetical protein